MGRVNYDGPAFGLGKAKDRMVFRAVVCLAELGMLKVDGDTGLAWVELSKAADDVLALVPKARQNQPRRNANDLTPP